MRRLHLDRTGLRYSEDYSISSYSMSHVALGHGSPSYVKSEPAAISNPFDHAHLLALGHPIAKHAVSASQICVSISLSGTSFSGWLA